MVRIDEYGQWAKGWDCKVIDVVVVADIERALPAEVGAAVFIYQGQNCEIRAWASDDSPMRAPLLRAVHSPRAKLVNQGIRPGWSKVQTRLVLPCSFSHAHGMVRLGPER